MKKNDDEYTSPNQHKLDFISLVKVSGVIQSDIPFRYNFSITYLQLHPTREKD